MTETFSFYTPDGAVLDQQYVGPEDQLQHLLAILPAGTQAYRGALLPSRHRVELVADAQGDLQPTAVPYQPPSPGEDEWRTWAWDADAWRWVAVPTLAALKAAAVAAVQALIEQHESQQARPQRDVLTALLAGVSPPAEAVQRLQEIEAAIVPLRAQRQAIEQATTQAELQAITAPV